jgi:hypothetical protein
MIQMDLKNMSEDGQDKSTWAIGGGLIAGLGLGLLFHYYIPFAIPAFTILGLGLGLVITSIISRNGRK